ncbi:DUF4378 domain protein [Senna tora]|uniref:DUF4378 domain protein n=1 Tax=Senna tora TaxID=362788 RepID=A0A834SK10_9FABA|nr:DUF4378 domain protein [Senna tora]
METEKRRSKGGFLNLFDWNGKSRKKLFNDNPNIPEVSKQGKENAENMENTQLNRIHVDENGAGPSYTANCDFSGTLSTNSDEGCGTKAPGLVARLMGLDSLPSSAAAELSSATLYGSNSLGSCHEAAFGSTNDYLPVEYINMPLNLEKSLRDATESRAQKVGNRPIKRFQTEVLPPKSAKPIPVTHNKLLSPIKSPGFIPPKNAAHIMEAAAKIFEASPRPYMKNNMSSAGPSSVPLRILSLKEKLEAAQCASMPEKPMDSIATNHVKGRPSGRSNNSYKSTSAFKISRDSEKTSSYHLGTKGKSVSLATQSKANVQSKDTLTSNGGRGHMKHKEQSEIRSNQFSRSQKPTIQQSMQQRTSTGRNSTVLGQNNQKQNIVANRVTSTSRIDSNKPTTRVRSAENSTGAKKTTNEGSVNANNGPKRSNRRAADTQKEFPLSKTKSVAQKKRYVSRGVYDGARDPNKAVNNYENKSIKCNITTDGSMNQDVFNMQEGKDVISFTFTSPLRRSLPESQSSTQVMGTKDNTVVTSLGQSDKLCPEKLSLSPPGLHKIDGDVLSVLLEKKLQELTSIINIPQDTLVIEGSSAGLQCNLQDKTTSVVSAMSREPDKSFHTDLHSDNLHGMHDYGCSSSDDLVHNLNSQLQTLEGAEEPRCSSNGEPGNDPGSLHSRSVTVFETPCVSSTVYSSMQDEEVSNFSPINEYEPIENGVNWSDRSSSMKQLSSTSNLADFKMSGNTELEYVKDILSNAELMAEDFVLGQTNKIIMSNHFDALENQNSGSENCEEEESKLERKVLFDCVSECLELRCNKAFVGCCKAWPRWIELDHRKGWLAEELYNEILGFKSMEEVMVDELVDKDMSSRYGRWLDFDLEAFEEALEIEWEISTCLINELISDLLLV